MHRIIRSIITSLLLLPALSLSLNLSEIQKQNNILVGQIHYQKWFFDIYDAELFSKNGSFSWDAPFLLKITYLRKISASSIIKQTIKEIAIQHPEITQKQKEQYIQIFKKTIPNVELNDVLYGYMDSDDFAYIYLDNGKLFGKINDKKLSKYFFEIWLSDNTSNPDYARRLKGL